MGNTTLGGLSNDEYRSKGKELGSGRRRGMIQFAGSREGSPSPLKGLSTGAPGLES
jgi:hypothetical protein